VKSYVKRNKTDAIDAEANCEAVSRPTMRFVPVKSVEQQGLLTLHRSRDLMIGQRTQTSNALRSFCAEFGVVAAKGRMPLEALFALVENEADDRLPATARLALVLLVAQHRLVSRNIAALDREIGLVQKCDAQRRLMTIPGIGILTASALLATIGEVDRFERGRDLAAWIGLTPRAHSSGGKKKLLCITKMGDGYLRKLLVQGAMSLIRCAQTSKTPIGAWLRQMLARKPRKLAALALANKLARIAWAILAKGGTYGHPLAAQA
jgi:transposase